MLAEYKVAWYNLFAYDNTFISPLEFVSDIEHEHEFFHNQISDSSKVMTFLPRGSGFESSYFHKGLAHDCRNKETPGSIQLSLEKDPLEPAALERYLGKTEIARWHSDGINRRTGVAGRVDEKVAQREDVKVLWLQELSKGKFVHAEEGEFEV